MTAHSSREAMAEEVERKHAPGPWGWVIHDYSMASLFSHDNHQVMATHPCEACQTRASPKDWRWGRCHTPSEADAALIAAAPDLLEALQRLLKFNEDLCADIGVSKHYPSAEKARAAIAKALGQT